MKKGRYQKKTPPPKNPQLPAKKRSGRKGSVYKEVEVMEVSDIIPEYPSKKRSRKMSSAVKRNKYA